jgi:hypothetical protein
VEEEERVVITPREEEEEEDGRCAVCGLDEEQTHALCVDTGIEPMGSMFMCDGNCGDSFHARCVGLVDSEGVCIQPEGEWFCSTCTMDNVVEGEEEGGVGEAADALTTPRGTVISSPHGNNNGTPSAAPRLKAEYVFCYTIVLPSFLV